jgi:hypothetical protein
MEGDLVRPPTTVGPVTQTPLTRIGAPPQHTKRNRRQKPWLIWVPVAVIALGLAAAVGGYLIAGGPDPIRKLLGLSAEKSAAEAATPTEVQIECANIKHAYAIWNDSRTDLETLQLFPPDMAGFKTKRLTEEGKTFLDAVDGHEDRPAKHLAAEIAGYNVEIGFVNLGLQLAGDFDSEAHQKAIDAWRSVDVAYKDFLAKTCA